MRAECESHVHSQRKKVGTSAAPTSTGCPCQRNIASKPAAAEFDIVTQVPVEPSKAAIPAPLLTSRRVRLSSYRRPYAVSSSSLPGPDAHRCSGRRLSRDGG